MTGMVDWAMARARMIAALLVVAVGAGVAAYVGLPKEGSPNIDIPVLYVSVPLPGVSASDSERLLVRPLEQKLLGLEGLRKLTGIAAEGHAGALLEFDFGWDKTGTLAETRALVDQARAEMPEDHREPTITEVNLSEFPILVVSLSGEAPARTLQRLGRELKREIEALSPVLEVGLAGEREELVEILLDPLMLEAYNVTAQELLAVISSNNRLVAAGALQGEAGRFALRLPGNFQSAAEIYQTPVRVHGDRVVTIADLAEIRRTFDDPTGVARFNGHPTVALQVKKRIGENLIDTVEAVKARVETVAASWPAPLRGAVAIDYSMDESRTVRSMVSQLEGAVALAVALVTLVLLVSLGLRSALLVGLAIPASFLLAFALLAGFGMAINNMVMFGLILAVGMLVDGAIVVSEYADRRLEEGAAPEAAYAEAARRMFWPIVSSTATTLCAFLPMLFWPGMPGQFMGHLPVTLIFVLSASLVVALIFLPVLGGIVGRCAAALGRGLRFLLDGIGLRRREAAPPPPEGARRRTLFGRVMTPVLANPVGPFVALAATAALMVAIVSAYQAGNRGVEFFVDTEPERAIVHVRARGNLSMAEKDRMVAAVERRALGVDGIESVFAFAGAGGLQTAGGGGPQDSVGQVQLEFAPWNERRPGEEILADLDRALADLPGIVAEIARQKDGPQQGKPIQLRLESPDWERLIAATGEMAARMRAIEGLTDVEDTRPLPGIDWEIAVDREAAGRFGADIQTIGALVQLVTRGVLLDTIRPDDSVEEIDIRVRFPEEARALRTLETLRVRTPNGLVPLGNFVSVTPTPALAEIKRLNGARFLTVNADVAPGVNVNAKIAEIEASLAADPLEGVTHAFQGDQEEQAESQAFLMQAFAAALGLMFAILLAQFNSLYNALLVLSAVVLSFGGVMIGMLAMDQPFSIIMTGTGVVALAGIVVNNNIVLIDTYRELSSGCPPIEAILRTVEQRLRPVLLTTLTTMAGIAPMMFAAGVELGGLGAGFAALAAAGPFSAAGWSAFAAHAVSIGAPAALWWTQLATAVVFGLGFSTLLTLVATPAALAARIWCGRCISWIAALPRLRGVGAAARDLRMRRRARRVAAPEILWDAEDPLARRPELAYPPRAYADAAE